MPCSKRDKRSLCALRSLLQPRGPVRDGRAEFLQYITITSTGSLQDAERMIRAFDDVQLRPDPKVLAHGS